MNGVGEGHLDVQWLLATSFPLPKAVAGQQPRSAQEQEAGAVDCPPTPELAEWIKSSSLPLPQDAKPSTEKIPLKRASTG